MTDTPPPEKGSVFIALPALKQMLAWSLLCLGIIERKDQDFELVTRGDGVVVRLSGQERR